MTDFSVPLFFNAGLRENRPMVIYDYASEWTATEKWSDKNYLASTAGISFVQLNTYATQPWKLLSKKQLEKAEQLAKE